MSDQFEPTRPETSHNKNLVNSNVCSFSGRWYLKENCNQFFNKSVMSIIHSTRAQKEEKKDKADYLEYH